jgi:hypothetical protein
MVRASRGKSAAPVPNAFLSFTLIPFIIRFFKVFCSSRFVQHYRAIVYSIYPKQETGLD